MKYINYLNSTFVWIKFYYNGVKQSYYFDDVFIIDSCLKTDKEKRDFKKLLAIKIESDKDAMIEELSYMERENITYKVMISKYYLPDDSDKMRLHEFNF